MDYGYGNAKLIQVYLIKKRNFIVYKYKYITIEF